ncbi:MULTISPECIES: hypothetical protein [Loigolactobacillus]|uniref:Uncharacterized protein n=1 Tax=Loigolactobacillus backii TaxID=375175 RepID=A0A192GZR5_9LACO|nr:MULTISPECIES: hypothetical protein [Loigolactobacillus]ANK58846.1 hypothetical protein AYR52_00345 [Loigolactobacillus backii]ANK61492.1 hypothetical protein AYR53_01170 [Loigolactobacillus backii]ANK63836.1 hypothetical protein AYR54_00340 [Loigolactobacillus backii]ANK66284.1 hypothetical protein AYR55_00340 [Loigolactobacillus backii]ANK69309.1 hypothetical protein AYR56_03545 [Loigolactobacillus backii]
METERQLLKEKQRKMLIYLADLYTQHVADHEAGSRPANCAICHEIKVVHEITTDLAQELKNSEKIGSIRRSRRPRQQQNVGVPIYRLTVRVGEVYLVRAVSLAAAIQVVLTNNQKVLAYATIDPTLYKTIPLTDLPERNLAVFVQKHPDFTGMIGRVRTSLVAS